MRDATSASDPLDRPLDAKFDIRVEDRIEDGGDRDHRDHHRDDCDQSVALPPPSSSWSMRDSAAAVDYGSEQEVLFQLAAKPEVTGKYEIDVDAHAHELTQEFYGQFANARQNFARKFGQSFERLAVSKPAGKVGAREVDADIASRGQKRIRAESRWQACG